MPRTGTATVSFDRKTAVVAGIIRTNFVRVPARVLVVGCGTGREAAQLAESFDAKVTGIDIAPRFDAKASRVVDLRKGDATALEFADGAFDFIYSYHALEHIPDFRRALAEMRRVLAKDGGYCVGTPNRERLVSYLGSEGVSASKKLLWNAVDWKARLRGKFRNEHGAHAGYARRELQGELAASLGPPQDVTLQYYLDLYTRQQGLVRFMESTRLSKLLFPSVYFIGRRATDANVIALKPARGNGRPSGPSRSVQRPRGAPPTPSADARSHRAEGGIEHP
jgi:ubiquinone/menaquinone biosynthesis C-methylase UbiE